MRRTTDVKNFGGSEEGIFDLLAEGLPSKHWAKLWKALLKRAINVRDGNKGLAQKLVGQIRVGGNTA